MKCSPATRTLTSSTSRWAARSVGQTLADVAEDATPAVVHVQVRKGRSLSPELQEVLQDYELSLGEDDTRVRAASGSGVIVSPQGRVVTNHHVVEGAVDIHLVLSDQRRVPARIVGADPRTDVAILQIDDDFYEDLDKASAERILDALKAGEKPPHGSQTGRRGSEPAKA